jgi:hypothetical protein
MFTIRMTGGEEVASHIARDIRFKGKGAGKIMIDWVLSNAKTTLMFFDLGIRVPSESTGSQL